VAAGSPTIRSPRTARWGRFAEIEEKNQVATGIMEEKARADATTKKLGDFYASCMDEAGIQRVGTSGIKPLLATTTGVKDAKTWSAAVIALHKLGIWVVWNVNARADLKSSTQNVTYLDPSGLGLPDRDGLVRRPELSDLAFDGDSGIVPDPLPGSSQRVEQRRLSCVRVAEHGDAKRPGRLLPCRRIWVRRSQGVCF
jgi:hypothetical protein